MFSHFKRIQTFSENLFIFSKKQKFFEHFEKTANFSCIPQQNCYLQSFQGEFIFFGESKYFFITAKSMNVLRSVSVSVEFYSKVATFSHFKLNSFFLEKPCTFLEQPKVWSFWEMLLFQLDSTANLLTPANFYTFKIFVRKPHFFILKKPEVRTFWILLQFQSTLRQVCCLCHF